MILAVMRHNCRGWDFSTVFLFAGKGLMLDPEVEEEPWLVNFVFNPMYARS